MRGRQPLKKITIYSTFPSFCIYMLTHHHPCLSICYNQTVQYEVSITQSYQVHDLPGETWADIFKLCASLDPTIFLEILKTNLKRILFGPAPAPDKLWYTYILLMCLDCSCTCCDILIYCWCAWIVDVLVLIYLYTADVLGLLMYLFW